jgi:Tfp pilus assembly protein PilO
MSDPNGNENRWHLSKSVPISLILFLAMQTIGLVIWAVKLDSRVQTLETTELRMDNRMSMLEQARDKLVLIEERQNNVMRQLEANAKKMDAIIEQLGRK